MIFLRYISDICIPIYNYVNQWHYHMILSYDNRMILSRDHHMIRATFFRTEGAISIFLLSYVVFLLPGLPGAKRAVSWRGVLVYWTLGLNISYKSFDVASVGKTFFSCIPIFPLLKWVDIVQLALPKETLSSLTYRHTPTHTFYIHSHCFVFVFNFVNS